MTPKRSSTNIRPPAFPGSGIEAELDGAKISNPVQFIDVESALRKKTLAKTEVIHWKGANDDQVDGILYYPDGYEAGKRFPLVTYTHGGPMGADLDGWSANPAYVANLLTQRGAFVLVTNYHGSANYGENGLNRSVAANITRWKFRILRKASII